MAALSKTSKAVGVLDPANGKPSWPFHIDERKGYSRYLMPEEVADIVLSKTGGS